MGIAFGGDRFGELQSVGLRCLDGEGLRLRLFRLFRLGGFQVDLTIGESEFRLVALEEGRGLGPQRVRIGARLRRAFRRRR